MSKFFVGQRVRVLYANTPYGRPFVGRETVVTEILDFFRGLYYGIDGAPVEFVDDHWLAWSADQLSPIIPDGHRSGDYSYTELMDRLKAGEVECV